jgi:UDP-glucose 6-dehydrogenase
MDTHKTGQEKFVIVGFGWVGQANAISLKLMGFDVAYFDPGAPERHYPQYASVYDSLEQLASVQEKDSQSTWYMICVGDRVSEEGVQDLSSISAALDSLSGMQGGIILRSTILPDALEQLSFDYYVPEFLHEKKAVEECIEPYFFVVGASMNARPEPLLFTALRERAYKTFTGTPREASFIKYLSNLWNALRIAFVNEFGDAIGQPSTKEELEEIDRILSFIFDGRSYLRYGRAFDGHCLPKDTRAFVGWYGKESHSLPLLAGAYETNALHRKLQEQFPLMPEWYSEWPVGHISGRRALKELAYAIQKKIRGIFTL